MKKTTVQFSFDDEKLSAIKMYMEQKDADLDSEMGDFLEKVYRQYVPANVRGYIDLKNGSGEKTLPKPDKEN